MSGKKLTLICLKFVCCVIFFVFRYPRRALAVWVCKNLSNNGILATTTPEPEKDEESEKEEKEKRKKRRKKKRRKRKEKEEKEKEKKRKSEKVRK